VLLFLFLLALSFHLVLVQRDLVQHTGGDVRAMTELSLKILGGLLLVIPIYAFFTRTPQRQQAASPGVPMDVFLGVVKSLREKELEAKRLSEIAESVSAGIAHEFRNLMGTILGAAKLVAKQLPLHDPARESVQTITHVISDMDHLITQFLNFARKTEPDLKPVVLEPWLKRVVEQVLEQVPAPHLQVEVVCLPDVPDIRIDEVLMRQAVGNLVQNAIEAMPASGRLTLTASVRLPPSRRREVELRVSDTGPGIPKDRFDKIFLPFFTTKNKGIGLGLALVHKIVLLHDGRIEVESQEGKGTTFRIYLPIV
jgi:signal transduction histidine kinase